MSDHGEEFENKFEYFYNQMVLNMNSQHLRLLNKIGLLKQK